MNNQQALTQAITLTDEILSVLEGHDFDRIADLERKREPFLLQVFSPDSIEQIDQIKAMHLRNLNQQVVEKLSEYKQSILQQQKQVRIASKATRAYTCHQ